MNVSSDGDDVTVAGKLFHTRAVVTGKAQSPTVDKRVVHTDIIILLVYNSAHRNLKNGIAPYCNLN